MLHQLVAVTYGHQLVVALVIVGLIFFFKKATNLLRKVGDEDEPAWKWFLSMAVVIVLGASLAALITLFFWSLFI